MADQKNEPHNGGPAGLSKATLSSDYPPDETSTNLQSHTIHYDLSYGVEKNHIDGNLARTHSRKTELPSSAIEKLPQELRQRILHLAIDEENLQSGPLIASIATALALVSRSFRVDMIWVKEQWEKEGERIEQRLREERRPTADTINELLGDLHNRQAVWCGSTRLIDNARSRSRYRERSTRRANKKLYRSNHTSFENKESARRMASSLTR